MDCLQVSIPSQRRYVGYWSDILSFRGGLNKPPTVEVPQPTRRELLRIRLYDAVNTRSIFFVITELPKVPEVKHYPLFLPASPSLSFLLYLYNWMCNYAWTVMKLC